MKLNKRQKEILSYVLVDYINEYDEKEEQYHESGIDPTICAFPTLDELHEILKNMM